MIQSNIKDWFKIQVFSLPKKMQRVLHILNQKQSTQSIKYHSKWMQIKLKTTVTYASLNP